MVLPDIKALRDLLKLLRSQGVLQYNSTDLQLVLSDTLPQQTRTKSLAEETMDEELSPEAEIERLMNWNDRTVPESES